MNKYFRKVVQLQPMFAEKSRQKKGQIAYYKFENRNKQYKIHLIINDIVPLERENYVFCLVYKDNNDYLIHELRTLLVKQNSIEESLILEESLAQKAVGTIIVIKTQQNKTNFPDNIRWVGYHEQFDLMQLNNNEHKEIESNLNIENKKPSIIKYGDEKKSTEQTFKTIDKKDEYIYEKELQNKDEVIVQKNNCESNESEKNSNDELGNKKEKPNRSENINNVQNVDKKDKEDNSNTAHRVGKVNNNIVENIDKDDDINIVGDVDKVNSNAKESGKDKENKTQVNEKPEEKIAGQEEVHLKEDLLNNKDKKIESDKQNSNKEKIKKENYSQHDTQQDKKTLFESIDKYKKNMEKERIIEYIDDLFENNENITPFLKTNDNSEWIQIEVSDLIYLPIDSWIYINNAFLMNCYRKYQHLILGRNSVDNTIILGVPDVYYFKNSIIANLCGFYEFRSCRDNKPKAGEYGYWIVKSML